MRTVRAFWGRGFREVSRGRGFRLVGGYVVCLLVLGTVFLAAPPAEEAQATSAQTNLFGTGIEVAPSTELHLIQAGVIAALFILVVLAARLSQEAYVWRWAGVWAGLLLYYLYASVAGFASLKPYIPTGLVAEALTQVFFFSSTVFVLLAGLHVEPHGGPRRDLPIIVAVVILVLTPWAASFIVATTAHKPVLDLSNAAMAFVVTAFTGWQLAGRARRNLDISSFPGGVEVFPLFLLWAIVQLGVPWLGSAPLAKLIYPVALLLKVPCSLSVVAIALTEAFQGSQEAVARAQRAKEQLESKNQELRDRELELSEVLETTRLSERAGKMRQAAYEALGWVETGEQESTERTAARLLSQVLTFLKAKRGVLFVHCPELREKSTSTIFLALAAHKNVAVTQGLCSFQLRSIDAGNGQERASLPDEHGRVSEALRNRLRDSLVEHVGFEGSAVLLSLRPSRKLPIAWILVERRDDCDDLDLRVETIEEVLDRAATSLELVSHREVLALLEKVRLELQVADSLEEQLKRLVAIAGESSGSSRAVLKITEPKTEIERRVSWPRENEDLKVESPPDTDPATRVQSPYPTRPTSYWRDASQADPPNASAGSYSEYRFPVVGANRETLGVLNCQNKHYSQDPEFLVPFTPWDAAKLEQLAEVTAVSVERARRKRTLELVVSRHVHEIRNPVSTLRNVMRWLWRQLTPEFRSTAWKRLQDGTEAAETLRNLVDLVDVNRGTLGARPQRTNIYSDIIAGILKDIKPRLQRRGVKHIQIETFHPSIIPDLEVKRPVVRQVIGNLLDNAVKYRQAESDTFRLEVEGDFTETHYRIRIRDSGIGIPDGWEEKIFEEGERAPNALSLVVSGMGMGLEIARRLARDELDGDLELTRNRSPTEFVLSISKEFAA